MNLGATGHQKLEADAAWQWVAQTVFAEIAKLAPPIRGITCLAAGADQLVSRAVLTVGGRIHAVLPFAGIERTFSPHDLIAYRVLLAQASVEVLSVGGTDEDSYLAAGKRVVEISDLLFAIWDSRPAKGKGGTADVVAYAIECGKPVVHFNPNNRIVARL